MTTVAIGTLGPDGWATSPQKKFEYAIAHFFASEYSQTYLFPGNISSLTWIVQTAQGDMPKFISLLETTLTGYLSTMFNNVVVEANEIPSDVQFRGEVRLYVSVTDASGVELNLGKVLKTEEGLIREIVDIINA